MLTGETANYPSLADQVAGTKPRPLVGVWRLVGTSALVFALLFAISGGSNAGEQERVSDREKQRRTMASMRLIATANGTMRVDTRAYAQSLMELQVKGYIREVPVNDAWGSSFVYTVGDDRQTYTLASLGSDSAAGPAPPSPWRDEPYEPDIVLSDGRFTQAPTGQ